METLRCHDGNCAAHEGCTRTAVVQVLAYGDQFIGRYCREHGEDRVRILSGYEDRLEQRRRVYG